MKKIPVIISGVLAFVMLFTACTAASSDESEAPQESQEVSYTSEITDEDDDSAANYSSELDKSAIMTFEISADPDQWQDMLDNAAKKEYIPADITINGTTIENAGIRPKGNSSLNTVARNGDSDRYSFKIKFDEYVEGQTWLGLDKMVINSNYSDSSSMKEYLSYDIMSYIGVDTVLFSYADISVNGEAWGLYLAVEDYEYSYLDRTKDGEGVLYKPESMDMGGMEGRDMPEFPVEDMEGFIPGEGMGDDFPSIPDGESGFPEMPPMDGEGEFDPGEWPQGGRGMNQDNGVSLIYTDDEEDSYSSIFDNNKTKAKAEDRQRVIEAIKNLNEGTELEAYVDVDAVLRYLAAHTAVVNLDSYSSGLAHNYILYENDGQISMLPWDYNMAFGGFMSGNASDVVNFPIDTPVSGVSMEDRPMIGKLLEVPEYMETYHQYLQDIVDGYFADGRFEQKVEELDSMINEYIKNDPTAFYSYEEYLEAVEEMKKLGTLRGESIQGQLHGTIPSTTSGQSEEPDKLLDASSIDLKILGDGGGPGGGMGIPGDRHGMPSPDKKEMDS